MVTAENIKAEIFDKGINTAAEVCTGDYAEGCKALGITSKPLAIGPVPARGRAASIREEHDHDRHRERLPAKGELHPVSLARHLARTSARSRR